MNSRRFSTSQYYPKYIRASIQYVVGERSISNPKYQTVYGDTAGATDCVTRNNRACMNNPVMCEEFVWIQRKLMNSHFSKNCVERSKTLTCLPCLPMSLLWPPQEEVCWQREGSSTFTASIPCKTRTAESCEVTIRVSCRKWGYLDWRATLFSLDNDHYHRASIVIPIHYPWLKSTILTTWRLST